jgi:hypothetical protein
VGPTPEFVAQHVETEPTNASTSHGPTVEDFSTAPIPDLRTPVPKATNAGLKYDMRRQRILKSSKPQHQPLKNTKNGTSKIHAHRTTKKKKSQKQNQN